MDPEVQKRYFDLRKQLSSLNYSTNFGLDAVDVVQQLFGDLIGTTESYSALQEKEFELAQDLSLAQAQLFPLKKENAKISRENQQLHMESVKLREEMTEQQDALAVRVKELEDELKEMTYLCGQKDEGLRKAEQQRVRLREAYEQLASASLLSGGVRVKRSVKMSQALPGAGQSLMPRTGIGEVGFTETKSPDKDKDDKGKKGIEGTRMALKKKNQNGEAKRVTHAPAPTTSDANEQDGGDGEGRVVAALQRQVEALQADLQTRSEHCNKLQEQLRRREDEWLRVSRQLGATDVDGGGSDTANKTKMQNMVAADLSNQRIIEQLNGQVDFLNEHLALREAQLVECTQELQGVRELQSENDYRGVQLTQAKENAARMTAQLRALEARVEELQRATDPESRNPFSAPSPRGQSVSSQHSSSSSSSGGSSGNDNGANGGASNQLLRALSDEKRDMTADLEEMSTTLQSLESGDALLQGRLSRTESARVALRDELNTTASQLSALQDKYSESQEVLRQTRNENEELENRLQKTQALLEQEAEAVDAAKGRVLECESRMTIAETAKQRLEAALSELKESMSHQRKELSSTSMARDDIDFQLRRLAQEKQSAVQLVERTQKELAITQDRMLALDASQMQLTEEKESLERQVTLLSTQAATAEAAEASRAVEHQDLLDKYLKLEQASREQEFTIGQLREQTSHLGESREAAQSLSAETDSLRQKYSALVSSSDALSRQVTSLNSQLEAAVAERVTLTKQLQEKSSTCASLQARLDSSLFETARLEDLISQRAQSSSTLEGHQESLGEKLNTATLQNTELQAELRLANRRLFDAESRTHQIEATLADTQHSYSRTTASLAKTEEALSDLTKKYEGVKSLLREREGEVGDLTSREERQHRQELEGRRDLRVAIEEKEAALKDIRDLKLLLKNMESDEKDTAARIRRFDSRVFELQEAVERASTERDEAKSQLRKKQAEVQELQESLRTLDADRDELQNQLDDLADEEVRKMHVMSEVNQKADDLANLLMQRDKVIEGLRRDKEHARGQLEKMDERFRAMTEETSELRRRLTLKQNEVGAAGDDLMLMTRENQSLTTELASAAHERDRLKQKVAGYAEQVSSLEHSVRALEIERGDLLETYRTCLQERRKYEVDLGVMSESKARLSQTINELRGDLADASAELASRRSSESRQLSERSALLLQVEALNDQLVSTARKVEDREADLNRLVRDKDGLQQTVLTLQQRSQTLVSRAGAAGDASKVLQARVSALEREREALRGLLDAERKRSGDMGQLIAASRSRDALSTVQDEQQRPPSSASSTISFHSNINTSSSSNKSGDVREVSSLSLDDKD